MNNINLSEKDTNAKDTEVVAPFNAKNILPESRGMKPISQLLEYMKNVVRFLFDLSKKKVLFC